MAQAGSSAPSAIAGSGSVEPKLPKFDCKNAPKAEVVSDKARIDGVAVTDDTIFFSTLNEIWTMPKAGSSAPKQIGKLYDGSPLTTFGDKLYYVDTPSLKSMSFDGSGATEIMTSIRFRYTYALMQDEKGVYAGEMGCDPMTAIVEVPLMGASKETLIDCPKSMTWRHGTGYFFTGDDDNDRLAKLGPSGELQPIDAKVSAVTDSDKTAVTDKYLYYWSLPDKYLARVPLQGGEPEMLAGPTGLGGHILSTDDNVVLVEVIDGGGSGVCVVSFDEATEKLKPAADVNNVWQMAADADSFYFATNQLLRVNR